MNLILANFFDFNYFQQETIQIFFFLFCFHWVFLDVQMHTLRCRIYTITESCKDKDRFFSNWIERRFGVQIRANNTEKKTKAHAIWSSALITKARWRKKKKIYSELGHLLLRMPSHSKGIQYCKYCIFNLNFPFVKCALRSHINTHTHTMWEKKNMQQYSLYIFLNDYSSYGASSTINFEII